MAIPSAPYQYEPLPQAKGWIRVLSILPRTNDGSLCVALRTESLDEAENNYDALSYMWGPATELYPVQVQGGGVLMLRENIYRFLTHCFDTDFRAEIPLELWIDSICINQADDEDPEKTAQVQQMGHVYARARQVIIWLSETSEKSIWAQSGAPSGETAIEDFCKEVVLGNEELESELARLVFHPYWSRVWITQEILLARNARFVSGVKLAKFSRHLPTLAMHLLAEQSPSGTFEMHPWGLRTYMIWQSRSQRSTSNMFRSLIMYGRDAECEKWQDRVYGLLGLVKNGQQFEVDYHVDRRTLLLRVLDHFFKHEGGTISLSHLLEVLDALKCTLEDLAWCIEPGNLPDAPELSISLAVEAGFEGRSDTFDSECCCIAEYKLLEQRAGKFVRLGLLRHGGIDNHTCKIGGESLSPTPTFPDFDMLVVSLCEDMRTREELAILVHSSLDADTWSVLASIETDTVFQNGPNRNTICAEILPTHLFGPDFLADIAARLDTSKIVAGRYQILSSPPVSPKTILAILNLHSQVQEKVTQARLRTSLVMSSGSSDDA